MGTRSLTRVIDHGNHLMNMYRQYDGYPTGYGQELYDFLKYITMVNGLSSAPKKVANGGGCLAAQLVAHFKAGPGGIYLEPIEATDCGQEYEYRVIVTDNRLSIEVCDFNGATNSPLFKGSIPEFGQWLKKENEK